MNVIPVEGECSDYFFSTVSPWDLGMVIQDGQDRPNSQRANLSTIPHHLLAFGRGHFLSLEGEHEPVYTLSPNTILHLGAINGLAQEMGGLRSWELVLPVPAFRL